MLRELLGVTKRPIHQVLFTANCQTISTHLLPEIVQIRSEPAHFFDQKRKLAILIVWGNSKIGNTHKSPIIVKGKAKLSKV